MRGLTLHRPWPYAVMRLGKRYENRTWPPYDSIIGERVAIHAAKQFDRGAARAIYEACGKLLPSEQEMPPQVVVGVATIADAFLLEAVEPDPWAHGPWCWLLEDVIELRHPLPCPGRQGFWHLPSSVRMNVELQLGRGQVRV